MSVALDLAAVIARAREVAVVPGPAPPAQSERAAIRRALPPEPAPPPFEPQPDVDRVQRPPPPAEREAFMGRVLAIISARSSCTLAEIVAATRAPVFRVVIAGAQLIGAHLVHLHDGEYRLGDKPAPVPVAPKPTQGDLFT
jgi:hypothetical protein